MEWIMIGVGAFAVVLAVALIFMRASSGSSSPGAGNPQLSSKPRPAASLNRRSNWLEGVEGTVAGKTYHIGSRDATLGRKVGNYIQIIDDDVSRVHVKLKGTARGVEVIDQDSNLGTKVNGEALVSGVSRLLEDGDRLEIGKNAFVFHAQADYTTNHGLTDQKVAGQAQMKQTAALGAINWKQEVADALLKSGGDVDKAAEIMGVTPEVFEKMMEQAQG